MNFEKKFMQGAVGFAAATVLLAGCGLGKGESSESKQTKAEALFISQQVFKAYRDKTIDAHTKVTLHTVGVTSNPNDQAYELQLFRNKYSAEYGENVAYSGTILLNAKGKIDLETGMADISNIGQVAWVEENVDTGESIKITSLVHNSDSSSWSSDNEYTNGVKAVREATPSDWDILLGS